MKKYWLLLLALAIGFALRVYSLATIPNGLTWDEAALGYNAYSILKTGRDEFGKFMPLVFKSFGDYKPGLYVYLAVPSVAVFGLNEFAVRFPSVIFGTLAILGIFLLIRELFEKEKHPFLMASFAALALSLSPWHIHFSRGAWETNVFATLLLFGLYFWLRFLKQKSTLLPTLIFACASLLTYQAAKLLTPLNYLLLTLIFWPDFSSHFLKSLRQKQNFIPLVLAAVFGIWFFYGTVFGPAGNRLSRLSIFGYKPGISDEIKKIDDGQPLIYESFHNQARLTASLVVGRYLYHFSPEVLLYEGPVITERGHIPSLGVLNPLEFIWLICGLACLWSFKEKRGSLLILLLLLISPLPASMTLEEFTTVRSFFMTIPLAVISGMGMYYLWSRARSVFVLASIPYLLTTIYTFDIYFNHSQKVWAKEYNYGYKQAMEVVNRYPGSRVIMTDVLGQPYIYYLFYSRYDPALYQQTDHFIDGGLDVGRVDRIGDVEFRQFSPQDVLSYKDTVFVGMVGNIPDDFDFSNPAVEEFRLINYPGGSSLFRIVKTKK